jgi:hypothetical protein
MKVDDVLPGDWNSAASDRAISLCRESGSSTFPSLPIPEYASQVSIQDLIEDAGGHNNFYCSGGVGTIGLAAWLWVSHIAVALHSHCSRVALGTTGFEPSTSHEPHRVPDGLSFNAKTPPQVRYCMVEPQPDFKKGEW